MKSRHRVWVEYGDKENVIRIFRSAPFGIQNTVDRDRIREIPRYDAVSAIRMQVRRRADDHCDRCGCVLPGYAGEMHERVPKGKGGEVSLENCWWLCHRCHQVGPDSEHSNRQLRFGEGLA